ncbi:hypothetical protein Aduo_014047 [Ancylostoma duodenale]
MRILVAIALCCSIAAVFALPQHKRGGGGKPPGGGSGHPHGHTRHPAVKASQHEIPAAKDHINVRGFSGDPDVPVIPTLGGFTDSVDLPEAQGFSDSTKFPSA